MRNKILVLALVASLAACNNNAKTEEQEMHERDSLAKIQEAQNEIDVNARIEAEEARDKFIADSTKHADSIKMLEKK